MNPNNRAPKHEEVDTPRAYVYRNNHAKEPYRPIVHRVVPAQGGMELRSMEPRDLTAVKRLHEQCFPVRYDMVSLSCPSFLCSQAPYDTSSSTSIDRRYWSRFRPCVAKTITTSKEPRASGSEHDTRPMIERWCCRRSCFPSRRMVEFDSTALSKSAIPERHGASRSTSLRYSTKM